MYSLEIFKKHPLWFFFGKLPSIDRGSPSEVFLGKGVLKIYSEFTGEHPSRSAISIKLQSNFIEITLPHGCSPVNLVHIFWTPFHKNTLEGLFLYRGAYIKTLWNKPFVIPTKSSIQKLPPKVFYKKAVLKHFAIFTGKSLFNEVAGLTSF